MGLRGSHYPARDTERKVSDHVTTHLDRLRPRHITVAGLLLFAMAGCGSHGLPDSLHGSWTGGNSTVQSVKFSDGGRVELNGGECSGSYTVGSIDGDVGSVRSGYIKCSLMDGYFETDLTVKGDTMTVTGSLLRGTYHRE